MSKGKKITISIISSIVAIILIVFIIGVSIIFSRDLSYNIDFYEKTYSNSAAEGVEFTVATYNIRGGMTTKENVANVREQLKEYNVDMVGLQEVDTDESIRSKKGRYISTLTQGTYKEHFFQGTNSLFLGKNYGIMNMSKRDIKESCGMFLPMPNRWFMFRGEPRCLVRTVVNINGVDVALYNTHLSFENNVKMPDKKEMRAAQIEFIYNVMSKDPCEHKIVVGDFNVLNFDEYKIFLDSGNYNMVNNQTTNYHSYKGKDVDFFCLDNIIYTNNLTLEESNLVNSDYSDHDMIYAKFKA